MATFRVRHLLEFLGHLWLQSFRRAVFVAVIGIIVASVRLSFSQFNGSGEGSGMMPTQPGDVDMNSTRNSTTNGSSRNVDRCLNNNVQCRDLPAVCLDCNYNESKNCVYGQNSTVSCVTLPGVDCQVRALSRNTSFLVLPNSVLIERFGTIEQSKTPPIEKSAMPP